MEQTVLEFKKAQRRFVKRQKAWSAAYDLFVDLSRQLPAHVLGRKSLMGEVYKTLKSDIDNLEKKRDKAGAELGGNIVALPQEAKWLTSVKGMTEGCPIGTVQKEGVVLYYDIQKEGVEEAIQKGESDPAVGLTLSVAGVEFLVTATQEGFEVTRGENMLAMTKDSERYLVLDWSGSGVRVIVDDKEGDLQQLMQEEYEDAWKVNVPNMRYMVTNILDKQLRSNIPSRVEHIPKDASLDELLEMYKTVTTLEHRDWEKKMPKGVDAAYLKIEEKWVNSYRLTKVDIELRERIDAMLKKYYYTLDGTFGDKTMLRSRRGEFKVRLPSEGMERALQQGNLKQWPIMTLDMDEERYGVYSVSSTNRVGNEFVVMRDTNYAVQVLNRHTGEWVLSDGECTVDITTWVANNRGDANTRLKEYMYEALDRTVAAVAKDRRLGKLSVEGPKCDEMVR